METRRSFLMHACASGGCACAYGELLGTAPAAAAPPDDLPRSWIAALLPALEAEAEPDVAAAALRAAASSHYFHLDMDTKLAPYRGDLNAFLQFLTSEWGWRVEHEPGSDVILIDEAKSYCVCPLVQQGTTADLSILCACSEGFASRMFAAVIGHPVRAEVTDSILRGGASCKYRITLSPS